MDSSPLVITRTFNAPVERVWQAWTEPEIAKQWWGPKHFTAPAITIDFRVGGKYIFCMHGKADPSAVEQDFWSTGVYKEIEPMKKIVMTDSFSDANGNIVSPTQYGMPADFPRELEVTITFKNLHGQTTMTLTHFGMPSGDIGTSARQGWNESFDKLAAVVAA